MVSLWREGKVRILLLSFFGFALPAYSGELPSNALISESLRPHSAVYVAADPPMAGIGIAVGRLDDGRIGVTSILHRGPATTSGVKVGDQILEVNGKLAENLCTTVAGISYWKTLVDEIRGENGTKVSLKVQTENHEQDFVLTRESVSTDAVVAATVSIANSPDRLKVIDSLEDLAQSYMQKNNLTAALPLYLKAESLREELLGKDDPRTVLGLIKLCYLYEAHSRLSEATVAYKRILATSDRQFSQKDACDIAKLLDNLGHVYAGQGSYVDAETLYKRALLLTEKALGPADLTVADRLESLAALYLTRHAFAMAASLKKRELDIRSDVLGPKSKTLLPYFGQLAGLEYLLNNFAEAEALYKRQLELVTTFPGVDESDLLVAYDHYAQFLAKRGRYTEAASLYERALPITDRHRFPTVGCPGCIWHSYADILDNLGKHSDASNMRERERIWNKEDLQRRGQKSPPS